MQDDEHQRGKRHQQDPRTEALLRRAAQVREQRTELQRRGPAAAASTRDKPVEVRDARGQADRVVMIVGGRHYAVPLAGRHPLKVAEALYRYIRKVERLP
jgi:hypothetical protein